MHYLVIIDCHLTHIFKAENGWSLLLNSKRLRKLKDVVTVYDMPILEDQNLSQYYSNNNVD